MSNKNIPLLIAFEGVDKSGKTTLMRVFNEVTNYKYVCVDRFVISSMVYDELFGRGMKKYYKKLLKKLKKSNVVIVFCNCSETLVRARLEAANEVLPKELENIGYVEDTFVKIIAENEDKFEKVISVSTTVSIESCVKRVVDEIENLEKKMQEE